MGLRGVIVVVFLSSRRRHTRYWRDWSSDVCSSDLYKHALRNALNPVITVVGLQFGFLIGGAVIVEAVFAMPGVGMLLINAIFNRDYPVVQGGMLVIAVVFVMVNLLTDLLYGLVNPRIRY